MSSIEGATVLERVAAYLRGPGAPAPNGPPAGACGAPSASTARRQVPALHRAVPWRRGTTNLDLGGGPWGEATAFLAGRGVRNVVVDPGWQSPRDVARARAAVAGGRADTATLANLLNVIPSREGRRDALALAASALDPSGVAHISVYEGDRSGRGARTRDGWQANRRLASYAAEVAEFFGDVRVRGGRIEARAPRDVPEPPLACPAAG